MIDYITCKLFFFVLDTLSLLAYLYIIKSNKLFIYFYLTLLFGSCCLLTSIINIYNINVLLSETSNISKTTYLYLIFRSYIYIIEWGQYILFLNILKQNRIKLLVVVICASTIIIHINYIGIEYIEMNIINISQYISPLDLLFRYFWLIIRTK